MKSYTDIDQSLKLAEILPLESADMCYQVGEELDGYLTETVYTPLMHTPYNDDYIPCWSLAALLGVLPEIQRDKPVISLYDNYITYPYMSDLHTKADNLVDACVEMIEKLHELKLI